MWRRARLDLFTQRFFALFIGIAYSLAAPPALAVEDAPGPPAILAWVELDPAEGGVGIAGRVFSLSPRVRISYSLSVAKRGPSGQSISAQNGDMFLERKETQKAGSVFISFDAEVALKVLLIITSNGKTIGEAQLDLR